MKAAAHTFGLWVLCSFAAANDDVRYTFPCRPGGFEAKRLAAYKGEEYSMQHNNYLWLKESKNCMLGLVE